MVFGCIHARMQPIFPPKTKKNYVIYIHFKTFKAEYVRRTLLTATKRNGLFG